MIEKKKCKFHNKKSVQLLSLAMLLLFTLILFVCGGDDNGEIPVAPTPTGTDTGLVTGVPTGATTGSATGTTTGTETGSATGTTTGTETGSATGTNTGTETGSATGTNTGSATGITPVNPTFNVNNMDVALTSNYLASGFIVGTAADINGAVTSVEYMFDGGSWLSADGTTDWRVMIPVGTNAVVSGTNTWLDYSKHSVVVRVCDNDGSCVISTMINFIKGLSKDFNGDGYADAIVGANDAGSAGEAYIYYGGSGIDGTADVTFQGNATDDYLGQSVASCGDVNGDGYADAIVGASWADPTGTNNAGEAYIYYGGSIMNNTADITFQGTATNDYLGYSVASCGDVNGDGYADAIVGAYQADTAGTNNAGKAYIYYGGSGMDNTADVTFQGTATDDYLGYSVASCGDVNGDGYADAIVGAYGVNTKTGEAYIYYGGSGMDNTADLTFQGTATYDCLGYSVASCGDVNGDGYTDAIIGAKGVNTNTGKAYIYYGGSSMNNTANLTFQGFASGDRLGVSVATCGDVNGDGYADTIIGAKGVSSWTGEAYIYYGGPSMDNTVDLTFQGSAFYGLGVSVATCGDVDGDGYADAIVGADGASNYAGKAFIYYGGSGIDGTADVTFQGSAAWDALGTSVASCVKVNEDGYGDAGIYGELL